MSVICNVNYFQKLTIVPRITTFFLTQLNNGHFCYKMCHLELQIMVTFFNNFRREAMFCKMAVKEIEYKKYIENFDYFFQIFASGRFRKGRPFC